MQGVLYYICTLLITTYFINKLRLQFTTSKNGGDKLCHASHFKQGWGWMGVVWGEGGEMTTVSETPSYYISVCKYAFEYFT